MAYHGQASGQVKWRQLSEVEAVARWMCKGKSATSLAEGIPSYHGQQSTGSIKLSAFVSVLSLSCRPSSAYVIYF